MTAPAETSTTSARAALVASARDYLGYAELPRQVWTADVEAELLLRLVGARMSYGVPADAEAEAPARGELPIWSGVRWERIAERLGICYDGTREGARCALKDEALLRTRLSPAALFEHGENAFALTALPSFDVPGCALPLD